MRNLKVFLIAALVILYCGACHKCEEKHEHEHEDEHVHEDDHEHDHESDHVHEEEVECVHLDAEILKDLDITMEKVEPRVHIPSVKIPGKVMVDPDRKVDISSPLAARILALDAPPHAAVKAGKRLALLEVTDPEVRQLQVRAVEARAELLAARTERNRTRKYKEALRGKGDKVAAELDRVTTDLEVQDAKVRSLKSSLEAVLAALRAAGLSPQQIDALKKEGKTVSRIGLYAPRLSGNPELEVVSRPVHQGQTVSPGGKLYELVALDRLLVAGEAFEADLKSVRDAASLNLSVGLVFPAEGRRVEGLKIFSVEGALGGEERITHFYLRLPNQVVNEKKDGGHRYLDWEHRAGSRVQILVPAGKPEPRFVLPADALVREGGRQWVFRLHGDGCDRISVRVESMDDRQAVIPLGGGLDPGDRVVVKGALQVHLAIEAAHEKERPGSDHGHAH
jgi:multidrug efflux pump subunit AcrA (membrane-fusion protein)